MTAAAILNHLWQSTWFALAAAAVALALRRHQARVRFWVWMAASLKFLIPFSALAALGRLLPMDRAAGVAPAAAGLLATAGRPFLGVYSLQTWTAPDIAPSHVRFNILFAVWIAGAVALAARWLRRSWRLASAPPESLEPGVIGVFRQRLVLPSGLAARLTPEELAAVLAHERCHMRRRDNFWSALHMLVETVFWFHPLVWIIGAKLVAERERACDEAVLEAGGSRTAYASGMLSVCRHYVASPLACAAGISGGSLTQRVRRILTGARARRLSLAQRCALATAALAAIGGPILLLAAQQSLPAAFDAAVIKPAPPPPTSGLIMFGMRFDPGRLTASNVSLKQLIERAYNLKSYQVKGPAWLDSERFDLTAETQQPLTRDQMSALLQPFLIQQFDLKMHRGNKVVPVYALVVAPGGFKMKAPGPHGVVVPPPPGRRGARLRRPLPPGAMHISVSPEGMTTAGNVTMESLANFLSLQLDRPVLNMTNLEGNFALHLTFAPTGAMRGNLLMMGAPPPGAVPGPGPSGRAPAPAPSLFSAVQQQLGLRLDPRKAPIQILVIDSASKTPAGN